MEGDFKLQVDFQLCFPGDSGKGSAEIQELQEMQTQSLGQEDPLEEEMATQPRILPWNIPWTKEPGGLQSMESQESQT